MIVTAWKSSKNNGTGAGYGLKLKLQDRDKYFQKQWKSITLEFEGCSMQIEINIDKPSFWNNTCRELISKEIGVWLLENKFAPWSKGQPPKFNMIQIEDNKFKIL